MFITKKHLPRRTFLRGVGATLALPLLDAMVPARTLLAKTAASPASRLGFVYLPHGAIMDRWTPAQRGRGLRVLADPEAARAVPRPRRRRQRAAATAPPTRTAVHSLSPTTWLSGVRPKPTQGVDAYAGHHRRSDRGAAHRPGHAAAVDGARDRRSVGPDRRLRPRLRLHLHEHAVVADADDADADGDQPAQGVRADVRPGRHGGGAAGAHARKTAASSTRSRSRSAACSAASARKDRTTVERLSRERARDRAAHPGRRASSSRSTSSCRRRRSASRSRSKSTSS